MAHMDGTMGSFSFLSLLAFLGYIHTGRRTRDLLVSAGAGGFAILAKIPGAILVPTVGLIALWDYWDRRREIQAVSIRRSQSWLEGLIKPLALWGLVALVTIFIFFPAMWANPIGAMKRLMLTPLSQAENLVTQPARTAREQNEAKV